MILLLLFGIFFLLMIVGLVGWFFRIGNLEDLDVLLSLMKGLVWGFLFLLLIGVFLVLYFLMVVGVLMMGFDL